MTAFIGCFLYLKEIVKGESYVMLSQEEVEALRKAVNFGLGEVNEKKKEKTIKVTVTVLICGES